MTQEHLSAPGSALINLAEPVYGTTADRLRDQLREPSTLDTAVRVAQKMLAEHEHVDPGDILAVNHAHHATREALRILLHALGAEKGSSLVRTPGGDQRRPAAHSDEFSGSRKNPADQRCPAAHPEDPTPCSGPATVTVLDAQNAGANGCQHHAARLLASLEGGRVYGLPHATPGTAIRVFKAAADIRPFPWLEDAPRTRPEQLSQAENRARGERP